MGNYNVQSTHCTKATQKFEVNHKAKGTSISLSVRLCDVSQVNCDPDFGKVLLHMVLTSNGLHTDVPCTDGSHWIYDRYYGKNAL